uniref:Uncharacterized protein n=1 Tax=Romanomermis culicivorax TaxID=13658 RepID=A0A915JIH4_ROMCU
MCCKLDRLSSKPINPLEPFSLKNNCNIVENDGRQTPSKSNGVGDEHSLSPGCENSPKSTPICMGDMHKQLKKIGGRTGHKLLAQILGPSPDIIHGFRREESADSTPALD